MKLRLGADRPKGRHSGPAAAKLGTFRRVTSVRRNLKTWGSVWGVGSRTARAAAYAFSLPDIIRTVRGRTMMRFAKVHLAALALTAATGIAAMAQDGPLGVWIDHTGRGAVEISECDGALCGKVVWVADQANSKGCGLEIIGNVRPMSDGTYDEGWIYDPDKDAKFDVQLIPLRDGTLKVVGYKGLKFFSQSFIWRRAPADLQRCTPG